MGLGDLAGDGLDLQRAHVGGRRIDHVAGQGGGVGDPRHAGEVAALRRDQTRLGALAARLVAVEGVAAEREGERGEVCAEAVRQALDRIVARRQARGQLAQQHGVGVRPLAQAEEGPRQPALRVGDQHEPARLALELLRLGEGARRARFEAGPVLFGHELDGDGAGVGAER